LSGSISRRCQQKAQIKQALYEVAATLQEEKALEDLGLMVAYLSLFVSDKEMDEGTDHSLKEFITQRMMASFGEFTKYVETHNPHLK
jgi:hypothetical protein